MHERSARLTIAARCGRPSAGVIAAGEGHDQFVSLGLGLLPAPAKPGAPGTEPLEILSPLPATLGLAA